jgi:hypothetical protein
MGTSVLDKAAMAEGIVDVLAHSGAVSVESLDLQVLKFAYFAGYVQVATPEEIIHAEVGASHNSYPLSNTLIHQ